MIKIERKNTIKGGGGGNRRKFTRIPPQKSLIKNKKIKHFQIIHKECLIYKFYIMNIILTILKKIHLQLFLHKPVNYSIHIRFFQKILFYHLKTYFINYTISFYNTPNVLTFIFQYNTLK